MKPFKQEISEGIADNISKKLKYSFFVDVYPILNKKGGLLTIMFPNVGSKKLYRWMSGVETNDIYTSNIEKFKSIYSKISSSSTLKTLYRAVNVLKTKQTSPEENDKRMTDLELIVSKIERVIKTKLSPEEIDLFNKIVVSLDDAADNAGKSIEGSIGASTATPEEPKQEPVEEPKEEPTEKPTEEPSEKPETETPTEPPATKPTETPKEEPTEETPKEEPTEETPEVEKKKAEESIRMQEYLKSLIRELVERKLKLK